MNTSAKSITVPPHARLKRDRSNYVTWQRFVEDLLESTGDLAAINKDVEEASNDLESGSESESESSDFDLEQELK